MWLYLNNSITPSANDLQCILLEWTTPPQLDCPTFLDKTRPWVVKANWVFEVVIYVLGINGHADVVVLLFQGGEGGGDLALFVGLQEGFARNKLYFVLVLVRNFPLVLEGDTRLILYENILFGRNTDKSWGEEQFLVVT